MTDEKTTRKITPKQKRVRHASAQASYMERKRAEGKEWLATWVPGEAKDSFRELAKRANSDDQKPSSSYISNVEKALGESAPEWALKSQTLLNVWLISKSEVVVDFGGGGSSKSEKGKKEDKEKKKKKKKK